MSINSTVVLEWEATIHIKGQDLTVHTRAVSKRKAITSLKKQYKIRKVTSTYLLT